MARSTTRIPNLTKVTTLQDNDVIPVGPSDGDRAKGITSSDYTTQILAALSLIQSEIIINGSSFSTQNPAGLDMPLQIEFGAAVNGPTDPAQMDANGLVTINQTDEYDISFFFEYGRVGMGSVAWLFWRLKVNGTQSGNAVFAKLDGANDDIPVQFEISRSFNAGDIFTVELIRDSQGDNSGGLLSETPTPGDWNAAPSANLVVRRTVLS